jgi:succinate dehydrogenase/fumarate reductase flavoprotein subunit
MTSSTDYDVIVVGSGIAGHCASLAALERGARVVMVDSAPKLGGSSRLSTGIVMGAGTRFQKESGFADDRESLYQDYMNLNQWLVQPSVARHLCYEAGPTVEWLADNGVEFTHILNSGMERASRGHATRGGDTIVNALSARIATFSRFDSAVGSRVDRLLVHGGAVTGIAMGGHEATAASVILACGGMGANPEMINHWNPEAFWSAGGALSYVGHSHARGDVIRLAQQVDAQIVVGRGIRNPACVFLTGYLPSFVLIVNQLGRRFQDETIAYAISEVLLPRQPGGVAYMLFDDAIKRALRSKADIDKFIKIELVGDENGKALWRSDAIDDLVERGEVTKAETIDQLARRLGVPAANLTGTVDRYNRLVSSGEDTDYFKNLKNVAPLSTGPFYAAKITQPFYAFTGTGVRIDEDAAVMHETSAPIPGLFAAGECVGNVLGGIYFGSGNSLANCAVFGRTAGYGAATRANTTLIDRAV